ncbi:unnamed protein product [Chrysodeixis includens]|uniref:Spaetzle domain-containing protein n=1 Tax=Chrysodeixis includens TaxID=689277 RepID=A0A9N8KZ47_CHRIL|nr:unnamed protein product [Chrysodeixis includens]
MSDVHSLNTRNKHNLTVHSTRLHRMAASAYKYKHAAYSADADPRYGYEFTRQVARQEGYNPGPPVLISRAYNPRRDVLVQNDREMVEQRAQLRVEQPVRRVDDSKVLSRKTLTDNRRVQSYDNTQIVFPDRSGQMGGDAQLVIPQRCRKIGICDDVGNYPTEEVNRVISQLTDLESFQNDKLDLPEVPEITQRLGPQEENIELCNFNKTVVYPKTAEDSNGKWHVVINNDNNPLQGFKVEICQPDSAPCSDIAVIQPGYIARCVQKFVYRKMAILHEGKKLEMPLKVPTQTMSGISVDAEDYSVGYVTVPNIEVGNKIARGLVEKKLAACVNIIPQIKSIYHWEGKINEDDEAMLMIKTRTTAVDKLTEYVRGNHPNTVCEVITLPIQNGNPGYLSWIGDIVPEFIEDEKRKSVVSIGSQSAEAKSGSTSNITPVDSKSESVATDLKSDAGLENKVDAFPAEIKTGPKPKESGHCGGPSCPN